MTRDIRQRTHFLMLFVPLAALAVIAAGVICQVRISTEFDRMNTEEQARVRLGAAELVSDLQKPLQHLMSLPNEVAVRAAIDSPGPQTRGGMAQAFTTLLQRNSEYDQARWIDETGREVVRVQKAKDGNVPVIVEDAALQDKSTRDYFLETTDLGIGKPFVSQLDLNIENGKVEIPYKPTIRFVTAVAGPDGRRRGILVVNYLAAPMLAKLARVADQGQRRLMLVNRQGDWLASPVPEDEWGTMLGRAVLFGNRYPATWDRVRASDRGQILDEFGLWTWRSVTSKDTGTAGLSRRDEPHWLVISRQPAETVEAIYQANLIPAGIGVAALLVIFGTLSWQVATRSRLRQEALEDRIRAEAMAAERGRRVAELEEAERASRRLTAIIDATEDAILSKDLDGIITSWNRGAQKLFGYSADEAIGKPMLMLFPPGTEAEEQRILERIRNGETIGHFETRRVTKTGDLIDISVTISPIRDGSGGIVGASKIARDITETKRAQVELLRHRDHLEELVRERTAEISRASEELREREKFITTVTDNLPGMVGYWDRDLRCRFANRTYLDWFGRRPDEIVGMSLRDLVGEQTFAQHLPRARAALAGEPQHFDRELRKANGEMGYALTHYIPDWKDGVVVGFFVLVTDVTLLKQAEGELREANERLAEALAEAKSASVAKSQFLANMSHEIRTPMNAVLGFIALVLEGELSGVARRQLTTAHNAAKSLLVLINDILDVSKLQSKALELERVNFSLPSVLRDSLDMLRARAREKSLAIELDYPADLSPCYLGDPMRVRQIVINLVGNAIKFTEAGGVSVSVRQAAPGLVRITVADSGIGMTAEQVERIFQPFAQADSSTSRRFGGSGLGLTICRQLAEIMGGGIEVESEPGKGSRFHATLHLEAADCPPERPDLDFISEATVQPLRLFHVLLADDIEENRELAETRLVGLGHTVVLAKNGLEVLERYREDTFDVVLMDIQMPEMNGLDAARAIRQLERDRASPVPIIALTASVMPYEQQQCFEAGMTGFVAKPIDFGELFRLMEQVVPEGRGVVVEGLAPPVSRPASAPLAGVPIDVSDGLQRWGDSLRYEAALGRFATKYADVTDRLVRLHLEGDAKSAHELTHELKGLAGNLAVPEVAAAASRLGEAFKTGRAEDVDGLIAELSTALSSAFAAIALLRAAEDTGSGATAGAEPARPGGFTVADREELMLALGSDDPGTIGPVVDRLAAALPVAVAARLRALVADFEFDQARALVQSLAASETDHPGNSLSD